MALFAGRGSLAPPPCSIPPSKSYSSAINWQNLIHIQNLTAGESEKDYFQVCSIGKHTRKEIGIEDPFTISAPAGRTGLGVSGIRGMIPISFTSRERSLRDTTQRARNVSSAVCSFGEGSGGGGGFRSDPCLGNIRMRGALTVGAKVVWVLHHAFRPVLSELGIHKEESKRKHEVSNGHNGPHSRDSWCGMTPVCASELSVVEGVLQQEEGGGQL